MLVILCRRVVGLKSLEELTKNLLRDFTPSSFQVGESRQAEGRIEIMRHRIEWSAQRQGIRIPLKLKLRHGQGVLCHRGALQLRHLAVRTRLQGGDQEEASPFLRLCRHVAAHVETAANNVVKESRFLVLFLARARKLPHRCALAARRTPRTVPNAAEGQPLDLPRANSQQMGIILFYTGVD